VNQIASIAMIAWTLSRGGAPRSEGASVRPVSPMAQLSQSTDALRTSLRRAYPSWSPEAEAQRSVVRRLVGGSMDYGEISRRALGDRWEGLSHDDRTEFVTSLGRLIEGRYRVRQAYLGADYRIHFDREIVSGHGTASVFATLFGDPRGKSVRVALEYRLLWRGDRWTVYDLVTDGQSLLDNYRGEFDRIITRSSFSALLQRMKDRAAREEREFASQE
jgi:phospholipid transport system substrate-binding protein